MKTTGASEATHIQMHAADVRATPAQGKTPSLRRASGGGLVPTAQCSRREWLGTCRAMPAAIDAAIARPPAGLVMPRDRAAVDRWLRGIIGLAGVMRMQVRCFPAAQPPAPPALHPLLVEDARKVDRELSERAQQSLGLHADADFGLMMGTGLFAEHQAVVKTALRAGRAGNTALGRRMAQGVLAGLVHGLTCARQNDQELHALHQAYLRLIEALEHIMGAAKLPPQMLTAVQDAVALCRVWMARVSEEAAAQTVHLAGLQAATLWTLEETEEVLGSHDEEARAWATGGHADFWR